MVCGLCRDECVKRTDVSKVRANVRVEKVDKGRWYRSSKEQETKKLTVHKLDATAITDWRASIN